jgi:hypothetical protein
LARKQPALVGDSSGYNSVNATRARHGGQVAAILERREHVYEEARNRNPQRWSQGIRNWKLEDQVWLNPERIRPEAL